MILIRWRPSGGRGEYEYIARSDNVLGQSISVRVPGTATIITTDVRFDFKDGKPRLRRANPNDRSVLNIPPLVAAIAALPQPKRSDSTGHLDLPLSDDGFIVSEVGMDIVSQTDDSILLEPVYLRPLHGEAIDIEVRLQALSEQVSTSPDIRAFFDELRTGRNSKDLSRLASRVHEVSPAVELERAPTAPPAVVEDELVEDYVGREGKETIRVHRRKERDKKLVKIAKRLFHRRHGALFCECCLMDFERTYGELCRDFIEAHHRVPLSLLVGHTETTPDDLAMLCADCHRMVHRAEDCSIDVVVRALISTGAVTASSLAPVATKAIWT